MNSRIFLFLATLGTLPGNAQDSHDAHDDSSAYEYKVGEVNYFTGEGVNPGGFLFPELFIDTTGGVFEPGTNPEDLATNEHDPRSEASIQTIEMHLDLNLNDVLTGGFRGVAQEFEGSWEGNLEEAYLHHRLNEYLAIGGGQFLNEFGFQASKHIHVWDFVNQNLVNSRMLNEGELATQGGEAIFSLPGNAGRIIIGGGGVRTHNHDHDHGHGDEEEHGHHEDEDGDHDEDENHDEEEHHYDIDQAFFNDWIFSTDARFRMPFDDSMTTTASIAIGENGFGENTYVYGVGLEKVWGAHDHGNGPEFCEDAVMLRSEFIGRSIHGIDDEDGGAFEADDYGFSTALFYGLTESTTLSIRHDWVSELAEFEQSERHRFSPAITTFLDRGERIRARIQYDYDHGDDLPGEHAAWLQLQFQWGGQGGSHIGHDH